MSHREQQRWSFLGDIRGRAAWVVLGCLICQLGLGFGYVFGPLAEDILGEFGWTRAEFSGARLPQLMATSITSPLIGWLVFRFGARGVLSGAAVILGLAFSGLSRIQTLPQYYLLIVLLGLAVTGLGDITVGTAVSQWVKRGRGLALGLVYTGSNWGGWLLTRAATEISLDAGWRSALLWIGVGGALFILPFAWFAIRSPRPGEVDAEPNSESGVAAAAVATSLDVTGALRTRSFWILGFSLFAFFFYFLGMLDHFVLFLRHGGVDKAQAAGYFSTAIGLGIASKLGAGWLADRISCRTLLTLDFGMLTLSSVALFWLPDANWIWLYVVTFGFATAARDIVYPMAIQHCFGERSMPQIYGTLMLALVAGGGLGPIFAGGIFDLTGSYQSAFAFFAGMNAFALLACCFIRPERSSQS